MSYNFYECLAVAYDREIGNFDYITKSGAIVVDFNHEFVFPFNEEFAFVRTRDNHGNFRTGILSHPLK